MGGLLDKANAAKDKPRNAESRTCCKQTAQTSSLSDIINSLKRRRFAFCSVQATQMVLQDGSSFFLALSFLGSYALEDLHVVAYRAVRFGGSHDVCGFASRLAIGRKRSNGCPCGRLSSACRVPYGVGLLNDGFVGITDIEIDEDGDELVFKVRGSFNSVDISVRADGTEVGPEEDLTNDMKNFNVPITDMFAGNGELFDGKADVEYTITQNHQTA